MRKFFHVLTYMLILFLSSNFAQNGVGNKVTVTFPFYDDVESEANSASFWNRDTTIWKIQSVTAHSGNKAWVMLPSSGSYNYLTLSSSIDLSGTANPYISLWTRKADGGGGYIKMEVSTNGGTNWASLVETYNTGAAYSRMQASLYNYRQANVLIRIGGYAPSGGTYYVDDILIDNAPVPQPILLSSPSENGMNVHWNQSTATDFYRYRIIISTSTNDVNNYYVSPSLANRSETVVFDIFQKTKLDTVLTNLTFTNTLYYAKVYEEDTQNFVNQGSERSDLSTTFNSTGEAMGSTQTFEVSYNWVADLPWAVTTDDAGEPGHSPTHAYEDSPQGNYPANADRRLIGQFNLSGRPLLKFNHRYSYENGYDYGYLDVSADNINWTTLAGFTGNNGGEWESRTFDIGFITQTSTVGYVRFRTVSNSNNQQDGWHIDDVQTINNTKTIAFPFFDDVEVDTFTQNRWTAGAFDLKLANSHSGAQVWSLKPTGGNYIYLTLAGIMNLSSAPNPYISLWAKKADGGGGYIRFEVSGDGGKTWNNLTETYFSGTQYQRLQTSLANYRQNNVMVRVGCYAPSGGTYYVDDILIDNAPTPRSLVLLTPTNNGMKVRWGASTAPDFGSYKIILSTDANAVNNYYTEPNLQNRTDTHVFEIFNQATIETTLTDLAFMNTMYYCKVYEQDTQLLINQGTERSDLSTAFNVTPQVAPFIQTFEGSYGWAADLPWAVTQDDAGDPGHSATHALEDSPETNYPANADRRIVLQINTLTVNRPVLRFNHKYAFENGVDYGSIDYSPDNINWTNITAFTGNTNTFWEQREFDISPLKQVNAGYLRFKVTSNSANHQDGWHIDDVEVYNNTRYQGIPLNDDAEVDTVSSKYWIAGQWEIRSTNAYSGAQVWALPPAGGYYNYLTVKGLLNLSSAPKPYVSLWVKKADSGGGYVSIEASNNFGATWTRLKEPYFSGSAYTNVIASLDNYRQANVMVRIGCYSPSGGTYYLDDISITDSTGYTVGIQDLAGITPVDFELSQNYPNPFNPSTTIRYALPSESKVSISVYNLLGQQVANLVDDVQSTGYHEVVFNAIDLASGVYLYKINAVPINNSKEFTSTKKLILLK